MLQLQFQRLFLISSCLFAIVWCFSWVKRDNPTIFASKLYPPLLMFYRSSEWIDRHTIPKYSSTEIQSVFSGTTTHFVSRIPEVLQSHCWRCRPTKEPNQINEINQDKLIFFISCFTFFSVVVTNSKLWWMLYPRWMIYSCVTLTCQRIFTERSLTVEEYFLSDKDTYFSYSI